MSELKTFSHKQFGQLEILIINNEEFFPATDVAKVLGYSNPQKAIRDHCRKKGCTFCSVPTKGGRQRKRYIDEGNLYRLIANSKLPHAEQFEELAKIIKQNGVDIGQNRLFKWLRDNGFLIKRKGESYNLPTQKKHGLRAFRSQKTNN